MAFLVGFFAVFSFQGTYPAPKQAPGLKWARTTDLTVISRVL